MPWEIPVLSREEILPLRHRRFSNIAGLCLSQGVEAEGGLGCGRYRLLMATGAGIRIDWQV